MILIKETASRQSDFIINENKYSYRYLNSLSNFSIYCVPYKLPTVIHISYWLSLHANIFDTLRTGSRALFFFFHFIFFKSGALSLPSTLINLWVVIWTRNSDIFNPLPSPFSSLVIPLSLILSALRFQKLPVHIDGRTFSDSSHSLSGTS